MRLPGRFEWKVLAVMLLIAGMAVGVATYALGFMVRRLEDLTTQHRQQIGGASTRARELFVAYFAAQKEDHRRRAALAAATGPDSAAALAGTDGLLRARLRDGGLLIDEWQAPQAQRQRAREGHPITVSLGATRTVELTFGIPLEMYQGFHELSNAIALEEQLDRLHKGVVAQSVRPYLLLMLGVLLAATVLGLYLARRVTRRVARLSDFARQVGAGDLGVRLAPTGRDELDELGRAFDRMVAELGQARARLEYLQKVSAWQEVARRLAHEIKNPLTPIQLAMQELHSKYNGQDPGYRRLLDTAREILHEEITGLRRLVDDFSAFAKLPAVEPAAVDLAALVAEAVRLHPEWQPQVRAALAADPAPLPALCDRVLFRRVIANLVENAMQAASGAGRSPEVVLRVERRGAHRVALLVDDNGPGVPAAQRQRIFDPYVTHREGGTGLGLAIVRKIVIDHGGDVTVEQAPAPLSGARLVVEIPLAAHQPQGPPDGEVSQV